MADINDYLPGGKNNPEGGIEDELKDSEEQRKKRQEASTPEVDWKTRYEELEVHNSRQAQDLGTYRRMVDEYITSPTPKDEPVVEESKPITVDDLYDNPDEAVRRAVESHPAIQEARELKAMLQKRELEDSVKEFATRHPDAKTIAQDPKFRTWVEDDSMRMELYTRGNQYDLSAADALFQLYKTGNNITQITDEQAQQQAIDAASLEESSAQQISETPKYSRSEYVDKLTRARQGDLNADTWVKRNAAGYRNALETGNVRD